MDFSKNLRISLWYMYWESVKTLIFFWRWRQPVFAPFRMRQIRHFSITFSLRDGEWLWNRLQLLDPVFGAITSHAFLARMIMN